MAKAENVKLIERHVEKLVLGVCLVALLLASWHWVFSSPTKLKIYDPSAGRTVQVSPIQADAKIRASAEFVQKTYSSSEAAKLIPPVPAWVGRFDDRRAMSPLPTTPTDLAEPRRPIGPAEGVNPLPQLSIEKLIAAMPAPAKPVVTCSVELPKRAPLADVVLARGLSGFPLEDLAAKWRDIIKDAFPFQSVVPYKVIVEVQQAPADGDWSKAKAVLVATAPVDAAGKPIELPEIPDYDGKNVKEVRDARDKILAMQQEILQPSYLPVWRAAQRQWVQPDPSAKLVQPAQPAGQGQADIAFFDDGTMAIGPSYRYRVQLVVVNPLLTYDDAVAENRQAEARQKFLTGKPGEWSDPVLARREVYFFVTGANPLANRMTVMVYARQWGQWVAKGFDVQVGEFIGGVEKVDLLDPMAIGQGKRSADVDFSTGCVALRLDFKKMLSRRGFNLRTSEMLYVDAEGRLQSRLKASDDASAHRKELEEEVRRAASE